MREFRQASPRSRLRRPQPTLEAPCLVDLGEARFSATYEEARRLSRLPGLALVVDEIRGTVTTGPERVIDSRQHETPVRLLGALLDSPGEAVPRDVLFRSVWGTAFSSSMHRSRLDFTLHRLRRLLGSTCPGRPGVRTTEAGILIELRGRSLRIRRDGPGRRWSGEPAEQMVLRLLRERGRVTNRELREESGQSRASAGRTLESLTRAGAILRRGQGRSVSYVRGSASARAPGSMSRRGSPGLFRIRSPHYGCGHP